MKISRLLSAICPLVLFLLLCPVLPTNVGREKKQQEANDASEGILQEQRFYGAPPLVERRVANNVFRRYYFIRGSESSKGRSTKNSKVGMSTTNSKTGKNCKAGKTTKNSKAGKSTKNSKAGKSTKNSKSATRSKNEKPCSTGAIQGTTVTKVKKM
jgi:hypothetical protein